MAARELMVYTKEDEDAIWRIFGRTAQSAEEDVEIIKNWMKAQPHLPEVLRKFSKTLLTILLKQSL